MDIMIGPGVFGQHPPAPNMHALVMFLSTAAYIKEAYK